MNQSSLYSIFKAYDVRGKVGTELTPTVTHAIGQAIATWLPETGAVAVGRDMRPDSKELADALIEGLSLQGRDVLDIGEVTSDMIYFATGSLGLAGGVMITASHNPGEYNGIKFCREGAKPIGETSGLFEIRDLVLKNAFPTSEHVGIIEQKDIDEAWIQHVLSFIDVSKLTPMKIAVDAGNGMAGKVFPKIEPYVPWQVTPLYFELDGTFPNHEANPLKFETLEDLMRTIREYNLDGGIAFDGDGDRAFLVDEKGEIITGNVMNAILGDYFLKLHPNSKILYDLRSSKTVPQVITENGGEPVRTRVGHSFIKQVMRETDAPFGGEVSGHFYFRDNYFADSGLIAAVIGLYAATLSGKKLSELRELYTRYHLINETNFVVDSTAEKIEALKAHFSDEAQDELDGLTVELADNSWFNVRPSNTEPVLRLNAEAEDKETLDKLVAEVSQIINS